MAKHKRMASLHYTTSEICKNLEESLGVFMKRRPVSKRDTSRGQREA